jgi:dihydrolipoamide dehydrogenase
MDFRDPRVIDAGQLMALPALPARALVTGGGAVAVGIADTLAGLGVRVVLAVPGDTALADEEPRAVAALIAGLSAGGVQVVTGAAVEDVAPDGPDLRIRLADGGIHAADLLVAAAGRSPGTGALGLDAAGITADGDGFLTVDEHLHTGCGDVYAVGDLLRGPAMSHLARAQGERAVEHALCAPRRRDLGTVPRIAWGRTPLAAIGLTARRAEAMGREVDVVASGPGAAVTAGRPCLVLLTVDRASGLVLGACAVGDGAHELMSGIALPVAWGCTAAELATVVPPGPGLAAFTAADILPAKRAGTRGTWCS